MCSEPGKEMDSEFRDWLKQQADMKAGGKTGIEKIGC